MWIQIAGTSEYFLMRMEKSLFVLMRLPNIYSICFTISWIQLNCQMASKTPKCYFLLTITWKQLVFTASAAPRQMTNAPARKIPMPLPDLSFRLEFDYLSVASKNVHRYLIICDDLEVMCSCHTGVFKSLLGDVICLNFSCSGPVIQNDAKTS